MSHTECTRCKATTKGGSQCSRTTCKYSDMCYQHTKSDKNLEVKKSHIVDAGQGLYATKLFKKGEKITDYRGVVKTSEEYNKKKSGYGIHLNKGSILDASSTQSGLGRYANNCRPSNKECKGNNATLVVNNKNKTASLKATKSIRMGEEIYVPYGSGYWK